MNRKSFFRIFIAIIIILAGVIGYFALVYKPVTINITEPPPKQTIPPVTNKAFQTSSSTTTPTDLSVLSLKEILSQPRKFDGKTITIDAYYYESTEKVVIASKVITDGTGWRSVSDDEVWISWGINPPADLSSKLKQLPGIGGEPDLYGRVEVTGIFIIAGYQGAGHLGEYKYSFNIRRFRVWDEFSGKFMD